jgi:hypothetical protein
MKKTIYRFRVAAMAALAAFVLAAGFSACDTGDVDDVLDKLTDDGNGQGSGKVATPVASPSGGTSAEPVVVAVGQLVTLTTATDEAAIYYTTGSTPGETDTPTTTTGTLYTNTSPISVSAAVTIKAIAVKTGMTNSDVLTVSYTIKPKVATPAASPAAGAVDAGTMVTLSTTTDEAVIYYTTGSTPGETATPTTTTGTLYTSPISVSAAVTLKAIATKDGHTTSDVLEASYTVNPPSYTLKYLEVSQGFTAPVASGVKEYRVKGIPHGKDTVTITAVSAADETRTETVELTDKEQTVTLDGGYTVVVPATLPEALVPTEGDNVEINITIAVRVKLPDGVLADKVPNWVTVSDAHGVFANFPQKYVSAWTTFATEKYANGKPVPCAYDATAGLFISEMGTATMEKHSKLRISDIKIYDKYKGTTKADGFLWTKSKGDREILLDEDETVYLFYTVTDIRPAITLSGKVTLYNKENTQAYETAYVTPAFYTAPPITTGASTLIGTGDANYKVTPIAVNTPTKGDTAYDGSFTVKMESFATPTQLWFIPGTVREKGSGTPYRTAGFDFEPITVFQTDITDLQFTTTTIN